MKTSRNLIALLGAALLLTNANTQAQYSIIHDFASGFSDGASPINSLTLSGSTLYGLTSVGTSNSVGMLFKINTDGSGYTVLTSDIGFDSLVGSLQVSGSSIYGVGYRGFSVRTLFRMNTDGTGLTNLFAFSGSPVDTLTLSGSAFYGMSPFNETIFTINTDGTGYTTLHTFGNIFQEGTSPVGSLVMSGSTLYGLCSSGGANSQGTVFKINTDGNGYSTLHNFSTTDGSPVGSLVLSGSLLYGVTSDGNLFKINPDGTGYTVLGTIPNVSDLTGDLTLQGTTLYGLTSGGTTDTVFAISTSGSGFTVLHSFTGAPTDGDTPVGSPVLSGSALFGLTAGGGSSSFGTVFSLPVSGTSTNGGPTGCLPTTQPAQHSYDITRSARYWFTHGYTNDPVCGSATLYQAIVANGDSLALGFLCLPTELRTEGTTPGAPDAFVEALGFYYRSRGRTGDNAPSSQLCKARKQMVPELIAAIANNVLLGTAPENATYNNGGTVTNFPPDLIEEAGQAIAGVDITQIRYWTLLLQKFNASGATNDFIGLTECSPNASKFLRSIAEDPTTRLDCPGINDNCAAAKAISFTSIGNIFARARFRDAANTLKLPSGEAYWQITLDVGTANRSFTVDTAGSNFATTLTVLTGSCGLSLSNGVETVDSSGLTTVVTATANGLAYQPRLSFTTDGLSTFYILVNGGAGRIKLTVTSP